ncbi:MAG: hypothetical protein KME03_04035 [Aphanocapsa lilacina HA4352-LM1]|jgi:hypothetical protein|nr:hypothetical protein [Aphanocapsa lilacina HA4352-LM1]
MNQLARCLWSLFAPVYAEQTASSRGRSAALCLYKGWQIVVEDFEGQATASYPRLVAWSKNGKTPRRLYLRSGTSRQAVRCLVLALRYGNHFEPGTDEEIGGSAVPARPRPNKPRGPFGAEAPLN